MQSKANRSGGVRKVVIDGHLVPNDILSIFFDPSAQSELFVEPAVNSTGPFVSVQRGRLRSKVVPA